MSETTTTETHKTSKTHRVVTREAFTHIATAHGVVDFTKGDDGNYSTEPLTETHAKDLATIDGFDAVEITGKADEEKADEEKADKEKADKEKSDEEKADEAISGEEKDDEALGKTAFGRSRRSSSGGK